MNATRWLAQRGPTSQDESVSPLAFTCRRCKHTKLGYYIATVRKGEGVTCKDCTP